MKTFLIHLNLKHSNTSNVYQSIRNYGVYYIYDSSLAFVKNDQVNACYIRDYIRSFMDSRDEIFVSSCDDWGGCNYPSQLYEWLKK